MGGGGSWLRWSVCVPCLAFFAALAADRAFVFRDSAHFYEPLFQWIDLEWRAGRIPLWNPLENTGAPVLADATSSVFYPGKAIFLLPLSFSLRYKLYVVAHVVAAQIAATFLARRWGASYWGAALAGVAYAYGGNVVFQHCNVVFLVGAAWLPAALAAADVMLVRRSPAAALGLGVVLALMVLGGDPQAAYHAGLGATLYAVVLARRDWSAPCPSPPPAESLMAATASATSSRGRRFLANRLTLLAIAALAGALLAAVQIVPAWEWAAHSSRAAESTPRTVFAAAGAAANGGSWRDVSSGLFGSPPPGTHARHVYEFSLGPWRLPEFVWPNVSGRMFPIDQRWLAIVPAEDRVWAASNYMGLLPLVCALAAFRLRGVDARVRWLSAGTLLAIVAAFGWYGLGWLIDEVRYWFDRDPTRTFGLGQPVGGLYWFMVVLLPGYAYFRFPAKLLVVASLGVSLLAARGFDAWLDAFPPRARRLLLGLGWFSLAAAAVVAAIWPTWSVWFQEVHTSVFWYGPLNADGATWDLLSAFVQTAALCFLFCGLLSNVTASNRERRAGWLVAVTVCELTIANLWLVPLVRESIAKRPSALADRIGQDFAGRSVDAGAPRVYRSPALGTPRPWWTKSSAARLQETYAWERLTLFPKHHLPAGVTQVESLSTMQSQDHAAFLAAARQQLRGAQGGEDHGAIARLLGASYLILEPDVPGGADGASGEPMPIDDDAWWSGHVQLRRHDAALPRAWIVHDVQSLPPLDKASAELASLRTQQVLFPDGTLRDLRRQAVVETDDPDVLRAFRTPPAVAPAAAAPAGGAGATNDEFCRVTVDKPQRVTLDVQLATPGLVILNDLYFPGWLASERSPDGDERPARVLRTNRIMRGVWLPAGRRQVTFDYRPASFRRGAAISVAAWLMLALGAVVRLRRSSRETRAAD